MGGQRVTSTVCLPRYVDAERGRDTLLLGSMEALSGYRVATTRGSTARGAEAGFLLSEGPRPYEITDT